MLFTESITNESAENELPIREEYINKDCTLEVVYGKEGIGEHFKKYMKKKESRRTKEK